LIIISFFFKEQVLDGLIFDGLVSLTKLVIKQLLSSWAIKKNTLSSLPSLEWLTLENNPIRSIEPGTFTCLTKLIRLDVYGSNGCDQEPLVCPRLIELSNLEILNLHSNGIPTVIKQLFDGMASDAVNTTLRSLDLGDNYSKLLKANEFSRLVALEYLHLAFKVVENGAFSGLVNLKELNISSITNEYNQLDLAVFGNEPDLANLRFLDLIYNYSKLSDLIVSSVDPAKLFAHCKHRVLVQYRQGGSVLIDDLARDGRIVLISIGKTQSFHI
jgi:Leucine-rich repeat (LRR) protein